MALRTRARALPVLWAVLTASAVAQDAKLGYVEVASDVRLHYRVVGNGGVGSETWIVPAAAWLYPALAPLAEEHRVVFYDTRGRGRSDPVERDEDLSFWLDVADLESLQDALEIDTAWLVGWSYLGAVAGRYAIEHPQRVTGLVLISPLGPRALTPDEVPPPAEEEVGEKELERMRNQGLDVREPAAYCRAENELFIRTRVPNEQARPRVHLPCDLPNEWSQNVARVFARVGESLGSWDWRAEARDAAMPVLVIVGSHELQVGSREWAESLPNATLVVLPRVGHFPWVEDPVRFFDVVGAFGAQARTP